MPEKLFDFANKYENGDLREVCEEGSRLVRDMLMKSGVSEEQITITGSQIDNDGKGRYFVRVALWEPRSRYKVYFNGSIEKEY